MTCTAATSSASRSRNSTATLMSVITRNSAEWTGLRATTTPNAPANAAAAQRRRGRRSMSPRVLHVQDLGVVLDLLDDVVRGTGRVGGRRLPRLRGPHAE